MSEVITQASRAFGTRASLWIVLSMAGLPIAPEAVGAAAGLEEIMITAQKRDERLIDVPISVSYVDEKFLDEHTIYYLTDLGDKLANVVSGESFASSFTIRGIASSSAGSGFSPNMGVNVDEVFMGRDRSFDTGLVDVANVELLRGPQGTLYGKNTIAGTLNVTTNRPTNDFEAIGNVRAGDEDLIEARGTVSGAIIEDVLQMRASLFTRQRDGYIDNNFLGKNVNETDNWGGRLMTVITPSDALDIELRGDYYKQDENGGVSETLRTPNGLVLPFPPFTAVPPQDGEDRTVNQDAYGFLTRKVWGYSAKVAYDVDSYEITSISAWREQESDQLFDNDGGPLNGFDTGRAEDVQRFSQEIRLASPVEERYSWIVGAYYDWEEDKNNYKIGVGPGFPSAILPAVLGYSVPLPPSYQARSATTNEIKSESWSVFASGSYDIIDRLTLAGGLRYTDDEKDLFYSQGPTQFAAPPNTTLVFLFALPFTLSGFPNGFDDDYSDSNVSGDASLSYAFSHDAVGYVRYARGYKAGGFQSDVISPPFQFTPGVAPDLSFDPEDLDSYEIGFKAAWFDGTLQTNVAVFYYEFQNKQEQVNTGVSFRVSNAAQATSQGAEFEVVWTPPVDGLRLYANLGLLDAEYDEFPLGGGPGTDFSGNDLAGAPDTSASIGGSYIRGLTDGLSLNIAIDANHRGDYYTDAPNTATLEIEAYTILNARAGIEATDGRWGVYAWGKNLNDEDVLGGGVTVLGGLYLTRGINVGLAYGLELNFKL
jgi:iron complex outermembrane receptor protein